MHVDIAGCVASYKPQLSVTGRNPDLVWSPVLLKSMLRWKVRTLSMMTRPGLASSQSHIILEEVINVWTPCIIIRYCGATQTTEAKSVTTNCQVSVHMLPRTACLTGSSDCHEDHSNMYPKFTNDRTVGMYFEQLLLLQGEQSSRSTLVLQAFTHPCANRLRVAVTVCSSSSGEIIKKTD